MPAADTTRGTAASLVAAVAAALLAASTSAAAHAPARPTDPDPVPAGTGSHPALGQTSWPVPGVPVRLFDPPAMPWLAGHRGVDLTAAVGTPVRAPADGVVAFVGRVVDRHVVVLRHGALRTTLEPVRDAPPVGSVVAAGEVVGVLGAGNGHCPMSCLHWGLRRGEAYLDPLIAVLDYRVRLLATP